MKEPMSRQVRSIYRLEQLAAGDTALHRLHPLSKLAGTVCFLVCVLSLPVARIGQLLTFLWIPVVLMALGEIPFGMILKRTAVALPFCVFAGLSNLLLDRRTAALLGSIPITAGMISFLSILLRTLLCVSAVLILVALTPFSKLTNQLRRLHVPSVLVNLLEMTYRYVGTLLREAGSMTTAYALRSGREKGLRMGDMGSFVGMLLIRSYDRAERVFQAMNCRGYGGAWSGADGQAMTNRDRLGLALLCLIPIFLRLIDCSALLGRWLTCWM